MTIKVVYCLTRKAGLTREQFQHYWLDTHGPKVKSFADVIGLSRYVQSHTYVSDMSQAMAQPRGGAEPYDGVMEGWMDSEEAAMAVLGTDAGQQAMATLLDDEGRFIDFERSRIFLTVEHVIY